MEGEAEVVKKSESVKASDAQLKIWRERNTEPGTLPCIPVIMINSLTGTQSGIVINIAKGMSLDNTLKLLKVAAEQVQKQMEVESN